MEIVFFPANMTKESNFYSLTIKPKNHHWPHAINQVLTVKIRC